MIQEAEIRITVALKVRERRKSLGMTQCEVAKACGLGQSMVAQIEAGRRLPSVPAFASLAEALHTTTDELLGWHKPVERAARSQGEGE